MVFRAMCLRLGLGQEARAAGAILADSGYGADDAFRTAGLNSVSTIVDVQPA